MSRLTITLSEARYRALKEASAQRNEMIGQLIDESLEFYGIKPREDVLDLVRRARTLNRLTIGEIGTILTALAQHAIVMVPVVGPPAPDRGDQLLWGLLADRTDLLLVTGDKRSIRDAGMRPRVASPADFIDDAM